MAQNIQMLPFAVPVREGKRLLGVGHTKLYELIQTGQIEAVKSGRRTLLITSSLLAHVHSLPRIITRVKMAPGKIEP